MADLAEVLFAKAEERRAVELGVAADVVVGVRVQLLAVAIAPDLFGLYLASTLTARVLQLSFSRGT